MERGINFLKAYEGRTSQKNFVRIFRISALLIFTFYCLLVVGVLSFWIFLKKEHEKINFQIKDKKSQVEQLKKIESLQVLLKQRLASLATIRLVKGGDFPVLFSFFSRLNSEEVSFTDIRFSSKREIGVKGVASSAFTLAKFLEKLVSSADAAMFSKIVLTSLARQKEGNYNFSLSLTYEKI